MSVIGWYFIIILIGVIIFTIYTIPNLGIGLLVLYISYLLISWVIACITKLIHKKNIDENNEFEVIYRELMKSRSFGMLFIQAKAKLLRVIVMTSLFTILAPIFISSLIEYRRLFFIIGITQVIVGSIFLRKHAEIYNKKIK